MKTTPRLHYLDHLRIALTVLVIAHHASQAYAPLGGAWIISNPTTSAVLMPFQAVNAAFFMGLFFLISGYFVPGAYDRKGTGEFLKTRFIRLGLPTLFFATFVFGPLVYLSVPEQLSPGAFVRHLYQGGWRDLYGHLWFLLHLLLYNVGYALWRLSTPRFNFQIRANGKVRWHIVLVVFTLFLVLITWVVRFRFSINQWVPLLYLIPAEMAHLPQYVSMFVLGILAYRLNALERLPAKVGLIWFGIGVAAAGWLYVDYLCGKGWMISMPVSGMNSGALVWSAWEGLVCVGLGGGLLTLFREWINQPAGSLLAALTRAQYGTYMIHLFVIVGLQAGLSGFPGDPFLKFGITTVAGAMLSFGISHLLVRIPGLKRVI